MLSGSLLKEELVKAVGNIRAIQGGHPDLLPLNCVSLFSSQLCPHQGHRAVSHSLQSLASPEHSRQQGARLHGNKGCMLMLLTTPSCRYDSDQPPWRPSIRTNSSSAALGSSSDRREIHPLSRVAKDRGIHRSRTSYKKNAQVNQNLISIVFALTATRRGRFHYTDQFRALSKNMPTARNTAHLQL